MKGAKKIIINFKDFSLLEVVHYNTSTFAQAEHKIYRYNVFNTLQLEFNISVKMNVIKLFSKKRHYSLN